MKILILLAVICLSACFSSCGTTTYNPYNKSVTSSFQF